MEIISYASQTWQQIPEQDNPAYDSNRDEEVLMIFKGNQDAYRITDGGFLVVLVPVVGDIIHLGVFWDLSSADIFAEAYAAYAGESHDT